MIDQPKKVAWRVTIDDKSCIVFAPTKPKARWIAVRSYREAGYGRPDVWPNAVAAREPMYDGSRLAERESRAWTEEYAQETV